jgi:ketosteroid isomerase-like protein
MRNRLKEEERGMGMRTIGLVACGIFIVMLSINWAGPQRLIATEEEVKQFMAKYIERYTQKDIDGFLWLFSPKAIQNQKDGFEAIRRTYSHFFDQSLELQYRLEEMKIELYENAVEVKALYQIDQIPKKGEEKKVWKGRIRWVLGKEDGLLKIISLDYQHQSTP